jgi:hypothetical protein
MTRTIEVCLGDAQRLVGTLRYDQEGARESVAFEYHATWLGAVHAFGGRQPCARAPHPRRLRRSAATFVGLRTTM